MRGSISNVIAGCFALAAFAVAVIAGLAGDNAAAVVLLRAIVTMILGYPVGMLAGIICAQAVGTNGNSSSRQPAEGAAGPGAAPAGGGSASVSPESVPSV